MEYLIPEHSLDQWQPWFARFGDSFELADREHLPPGIGAACEPEGFSWQPRRGAYNRVEATADGVRVDIDGDLTSAVFGDGGRVHRVIDTAAAEAWHEHFYLPVTAEGFGLGRVMLQRSAILYGQIGVEAIRLRAEDIGKYAWARLGFEFADDGSREAVNEAVRRFASEELHLWDDPPFVDEPWQFPLVFDEDEHGEPVTIPAAAINRALEERYAQAVFGPAHVEGDLLASKALLLYADIEGWNGILRLDPDNAGFRRLWGIM